jgi:mono/diheme cytochrome c family protein
MKRLVWSVTAAVVATSLLAAVAMRAPLAGQGQEDRRADVFVRQGCNDCHAIAGLGVRASADVGPDLTFAYADVPLRYGVSLESFLDNPTGIMRLVFASHVRLPAADRDSILETLRALYLERRADMDPGMPSAPPRNTRAARGSGP